MSKSSLQHKDPAPIFAALGDPTRLSIFTKLADGRSRSIASLSADAGMTRQAVTKHLKVLEEAGLVEHGRDGRESRYSFVPDQVVALQSYLDRVSRQWDDALERLKAHLDA
jgi:DNA-binding transcriptional ArsR family regulator